MSLEPLEVIVAPHILDVAALLRAGADAASIHGYLLRHAPKLVPTFTRIAQSL